MLKSILRDDRGQATTEYILILAVVVLVAVKFRGLFLKQIGKTMDSTFRAMDNAAQSPDLN